MVRGNVTHNTTADGDSDVTTVYDDTKVTTTDDDTTLLTDKPMAMTAGTDSYCHTCYTATVVVLSLLSIPSLWVIFLFFTASNRLPGLTL